MTGQAETTLDAEIRRLEESLLSREVRSSPTALARLIADDFIEHGSSGRVWTKAAIIAALPTEPETAYTVSDFRTRRLSSTVVLATYRVTRSSAGETRRSLRSSLWKLNGEQWQMVFHQGTTIV